MLKHFCGEFCGEFFGRWKLANPLRKLTISGSVATRGKPARQGHTNRHAAKVGRMQWFPWNIGRLKYGLGTITL
jgi:hypothetical protein